MALAVAITPACWSQGDDLAPGRTAGGGAPDRTAGSTGGGAGHGTTGGAAGAGGTAGSAGSTAGSTGGGSAGLDDVPPPRVQYQVLGSVANTDTSYRRQIADVLPLGPKAFVVGYSDASGALRYAAFAERTELESRDGGGPASWLRAQALSWPDAPDPACPAGVPRAAGAFAIEAADRVRVDIHQLCGASTWRTWQTLDIDAGIRPAVALRPARDGAPPRLLVTYGRLGQLMGRFVELSDAGVAELPSAPFPILDFTLGGAFSTDVVYNAHSDAFIVGYIQRGGFACSVWNVALAGSGAPPEIVAGPTQFGVCDGDQGGHHTASAYAPPPIGDGTYVWWRTDMNGRKWVAVHDALGAAVAGLALPTELMSGGNIWTVPVAATNDPANPYVFLFGSPSPGLWGLTGAPAAFAVLDGALGTGVQVALRALEQQTVVLIKVARGSTADLMLLFSDRP